MNRLLLSAHLVERGVMRYTPAGLPALDMTLRHVSEVTQDGLPRQVALEISATGIGHVTAALAALALGASGSFGGFLAAQRNGRGLRFHITSVDAPAPEV